MSDNSNDTLRCSDATDSYFDTVFLMYAALASRDYDEAAQLVRENLAYIPEWVEETRIQRGSFDIAAIPTLEQGGTVLALLGDEAGIDRMRDLVYSIPHLARWAVKVREHQRELELFKAIQSAVSENPNCLQADIADLVDESDGRRVANLISYLERSGKLIRKRDGCEYRFMPVTSDESPSDAAAQAG